MRRLFGLAFLSLMLPAAPAAAALGNVPSLERAIRDLAREFGPRYPQADAYLARLAQLAPGDEAGFTRLQREALLANPLLAFDRLLLVRRAESSPLGLPMNYEGNSSLPRTGFVNEIAVLTAVRSNGAVATLFKPPDSRFVGDLKLHFDANRLLFSSVDTNNCWRVFELPVAGGTPVRVPQIEAPDVDNYDACYLPDDSLIFASTAPFTGVPCVRGSSHVVNLYLWSRPAGTIRRLTFDQDHNWCPTVMHDGRVMYLRWEYADLPHFVARILFTMNPDGTNQRELYGSNSYWPNALFYAKPMPGHPTKFVGIVGGHHDVPRMGELVLFDPAHGRFEAEGAVQRIPGYGQPVQAVIRDALVGGSWPKFLHPWPLNDRYLLAAVQPGPSSRWGIYLVDVFDNLVLLKEEPGFNLLEPIPLRPQTRPPVIPSRLREGESNATLRIVDIYRGPGLQGVPRGTIKKLRLFTYQFAYHGMGGQIDRVGMDGPWDVKRILGTVPVAPDGSACFEVPANTPLSLQPLDKDNRAVALMRSWTTAMPGEVQTCVGCHEPQNSAAGVNQTARAAPAAPDRIAPWYGPTRGFSFDREVQPVLDRYCIGCHNGTPPPAAARVATRGRDAPPTNHNDSPLPDFTRRPQVHAASLDPGYAQAVTFPPAYLALRSFVRAATMESDMHLLPPYEFHASVSELIQTLERGHHGVRLDAEAWDRLQTWIDLNTPAHGSWTEICGPQRVQAQAELRRHFLHLYANIDDHAEDALPAPGPVATVMPAPEATPARDDVRCPDWPFSADEAVRRQKEAGAVSMKVDLGGDVPLELMRIPAGRFVMGGGDVPRRTADVGHAFWIGKCEISNAQYARFDARHDSGLEHAGFLQFDERERGYLLNTPAQPVCRVSWRQAQAFCDWLGARTGKAFRLPSETQWEWACRAGTDTPMWFGDVQADFSRYANLADATLRRMETFGWGLPSGAVPEWRPAATAFDDGQRVSAPVGSYAPNPWGLHDMLGNVAEWTRDADTDGVRKVVRGGSWFDRPFRATAAYRLAYLPWQGVYNVGFRVVCEE